MVAVGVGVILPRRHGAPHHSVVGSRGAGRQRGGVRRDDAVLVVAAVDVQRDGAIVRVFGRVLAVTATRDWQHIVDGVSNHCFCITHTRSTVTTDTCFNKIIRRYNLHMHHLLRLECDATLKVVYIRVVCNPVCLVPHFLRTLGVLYQLRAIARATLIVHAARHHCICYTSVR